MKDFENLWRRRIVRRTSDSGQKAGFHILACFPPLDGDTGNVFGKRNSPRVERRWSIANYRPPPNFMAGLIRRNKSNAMPGASELPKPINIGGMDFYRLPVAADLIGISRSKLNKGLGTIYKFRWAQLGESRKSPKIVAAMDVHAHIREIERKVMRQVQLNDYLRRA